MSIGNHQKNIVSDTIKYIPATLIRAFAGFLIVPLLTHFFDAELYGKYVFAMSVFTFLQTFVGSWINVTVIRFYAQAEIKQETHVLTDSMLTITLLSSITMSLIAWLFIILTKPYIDDTLLYLLILVPFMLITSNIVDLPLQTLRAQRKISQYSVLTAISTISVPIIGILISYILNGAIVGLIIGSIVARGVIIFFAYKICYRTIPRLNHFRREYARDLISFGLPVMPAMIFYTILDISDRFILNVFHGSKELGIYAVNYTISWTIISLIGTLVSQSSAPLVVSVWEKEGKTSTERIINALLRTYLIIGIPSVVGLVIISSQLSTLLLAPEYVEGAIIYPFIASSALFMGIQWIAQRGIILNNRTDLLLKIFFAGSTCNVLLNIALVPSLGYFGSAIATLIAVIIITGFISYFSTKYITISIPWISIGRIFAACGVMMIVSGNIPDLGNNIINITIQCVISAAIYSIMLIILKEWHISDVVRTLRSYRIIK